MPRTLRSLPFALAATSLLVPAAAHAATTSAAYPAVSSVSPLKLEVGDQLTIKGTHFRAGAGKTTVVFQRTGKPAIFVKATTATTTKLTVRIPDKIAAALVQKKGVGTATQFKLRVLTTKFAKSWTPTKASPTISPRTVTDPLAPGTSTGTPAPSLTAPTTPAAVGDAPAAQTAPVLSPYEQCRAAAPSSPNADSDGDGLTNGLELGLKYPTDPCNADSDGDGVTDGYEYDSAKDLNGSAVPYPGSEPYPNPLDPTDTNYDFDGDGLLMWQEFTLWKAAGAHYPVTVYSDGKQATQGLQPVVTQAQQYLDLDHSGYLTDDELDEDGDGLSNIVEFSYRGTQAWWKGIDLHYKPHGTDPDTSYVEAPYTLRAFSDLDPTNADSDGDGILDGADDQDNDGWSNFAEMQLSRDEIGYRVQPFNPCLPDPHSPVCSRYIPLNGSSAWAPFDTVAPNIMSAMPGDAIPFAWPAPVDYADWQTAGSPTAYTGTMTGPWDPSPWFTAAWDGRTGLQGP